MPPAVAADMSRPCRGAGGRDDVPVPWVTWSMTDRGNRAESKHDRPENDPASVPAPDPDGRSATKLNERKIALSHM